MALTSDLEREEFNQCYLQYRWLDDTRSKLVDRFFVISLAVLGARFQFDTFFVSNRAWLAVLYVLYVVVVFVLARSIIMFRRQQRGHMRYIMALRDRLIEGQHAKEFTRYRAFLKGKRVYLTTWIDFVVALMATASPLLLMDALGGPASVVLRLPWLLTGTLAIGWLALVILLLFVPFYIYNFDESPDWERH